MDRQDLITKVEYVKTEDDGFGRSNPQENKSYIDAGFLTKKQKKSSKSGEERRQRKVLEPGMRVGHWTPEEKKKYHWFLEIYHSHFENKQLRRMDKIFKTMADFLGSRAADQCRSHHQKMEKKYKNFYNIIFNLRSLHYGSADIQELRVELTNCNIEAPESMIAESHLLERLEQIEGQQEAAFGESRPMHLEIQSPKYHSQPNLYSDINHMEQPLQFLSGELSSEHLI